MGGQSGGEVGGEEDQSITVIVDSCELNHAVVIVEQLGRQLAAADEDYYQVLVAQSKYSRKLDV